MRRAAELTAAFVVVWVLFMLAVDASAALVGMGATCVLVAGVVALLARHDAMHRHWFKFAWDVCLVLWWLYLGATA